MAISLASLKRNTPKPPIIIAYGSAGIGKTTLAACAPNPVFIQTEDGMGSIDATCFPICTSFDDVMGSLQALYVDQHDFKTLAIDSLDWLEPLVWQKVCQMHNQPSIEAFGYGRGYVEALVLWRQFFEGVAALRDSKGMIAVLIAHSQVTRIEDPTLPAYDSVGLKLHKRAAAICEEFADCIFYCTTKVNTITEDKGFNNKRVRATSTGDRIMHTVGQPAFLAKNRFSLPSPLPLAWDAFAECMTPGNASAAANT